MNFPEVKNYPDTPTELNFVDYNRFGRVRELFALIRQYDAFPLTPVIVSPEGQVDMSTRSKQGDCKVDWQGSWYDIVKLINETMPTIREIIGYYKKAVRSKKVTPGPDDMYPGDLPNDGHNFGEPYDDKVNLAGVFFVEFYKVRKELEAWSERGMELYSKEHGLEIEEQLVAPKVQQLRSKKVSDMTGDDLFTLLEFYDKYKSKP